MKQYSYDLTQKLTFFVISIQLIFCGYILLNSDKLGILKHSSLLYLLAGASALSGIIWRTCYNETFHAQAHEKKNFWIKCYSILQNISYSTYIILTLSFFISLLCIGFNYLNDIENQNIVFESNSAQNDKITKSLNNIAYSIEKLSKVDPNINIEITIPEKSKNK